VCLSFAVFQTAIFSEDIKWTLRRDRGEWHLWTLAHRRGCLGGDRLGLLLISDKKVFLSNCFYPTERHTK
jgi:hypothetical protein